MLYLKGLAKLLEMKHEDELAEKAVLLMFWPTSI